jgi:acyl carrier protein
MPLENVRVRVNTFFNSGEGYTDEDGNVTISRGWGGKFKNAVQYKIIWSTDFWKIHDDSGKAKYEGPKQREPWNDLVIDGSVSSKVAMCATIHRALNAYYYESSPKTYGLVKVDHINVRARWNEHFGNGAVSRFYPRLNNKIHIVSRNSDLTLRTNIEMLSSTLHELGHASHWQAIKNLPGMNVDDHYKNVYIKETWANGVQYAYVSSLYPNNFIGTLYYDDDSESDDDYTAVIESLMNQGVTLAQLQTIFMGKVHLWQCVQPVKNLGIVPDAIVDIIFSDDCRYDPLLVNLSNNVIQGPDEPALNCAVTYTVPAGSSLPAGMMFEGFEVSGEDSNRYYSYSSGGNLNVTFKTASLFTITATYTLPDDTEYEVTKTVTPPPPPPSQADIDDIRDAVISIIEERIGSIYGVEVTLSSHLINDLGADYLDILNLCMAFEDEFDIEISDEYIEILQAVDDFYYYIIQHRD